MARKLSKGMMERYIRDAKGRITKSEKIIADATRRIKELVSDLKKAGKGKKATKKAEASRKTGRKPARKNLR